MSDYINLEIEKLSSVKTKRCSGDDTADDVNQWF